MLPIAMLMILLYGWMHWRMGGAAAAANTLTIEVIGWAGVGVMLLLFVCTAMIYACIRFLQEWASPWTLVNFCLLGLGSGFLLATALAASLDFERVLLLWFSSVALILAGLLTRLASLHRNSRIKAKSTVQSAIGIKHRDIKQRSMGLTGGSFNTRAFFHHCSEVFIGNVRLLMLVAAFALPLVCLVVFRLTGLSVVLWIAVVIQYAGLLAERWLFFAQANHPQNLYYQTVG